MSDRREYNATLVGSDAGTDVALLRVMTDDAAFTEIPIGDSSELAVGDYVVAIGNPFGLGQTATAGIVSALGRSGVNIESYEDFIQTDASINPGNSGGALVDINGQLLGVNTAILSGTGGNIGIGFAIPSNMVREVVEQLLEHGNVQRGRIGIAIQDVTPGLSQALELDDGPRRARHAGRAGLAGRASRHQAGDVIVAIDGKPIDSSADLRNEVGLVRAGESVDVTFDARRRAPHRSRHGSGRHGRRRRGRARRGSRHRSRYWPARRSWRCRAIIPRTAACAASGSAPSRRAPRPRASACAPTTSSRASTASPIASVADLTAALNRAAPPIALQVQREGRALFLLVR